MLNPANKSVSGTTYQASDILTTIASQRWNQIHCLDLSSYPDDTDRVLKNKLHSISGLAKSYIVECHGILCDDVGERVYPYYTDIPVNIIQQVYS